MCIRDSFSEMRLPCCRKGIYQFTFLDDMWTIYFTYRPTVHSEIKRLRLTPLLQKKAPKTASKNKFVDGSYFIPSKYRPARSSRLSLIHISEPTRLLSISYAVFCLKKKK